jgi:hypothetical protein
MQQDGKNGALGAALAVMATSQSLTLGKNYPRLT